MIAQHRAGYVLILAVILVAAVGCQSTPTGHPSAYADDSRIAADVQAKIAADPALSATNVGVTSSDGVVYLTGVVPAADRLQRATLLASEVRGVRSVVNNMGVAAAPVPAPTVMAPPPGTIIVPPVNVIANHPPVDVTGTISRYDPNNGIIMFQDGRAVRMTTDSRVAGPAGALELQPGARVTVLNVHPISYQPAATYQPPVAPAAGAWRIGTVSHVDATKGLIFLTDGAIVHVGPSTYLGSGNQVVALSQVQPGSQVAISVPSPGAAPAPSTTVYSGSAMPRQMVVPLDTPEVRIFVVPR